MSSHVTVLRGILSEGTVSFHAVFAKAFKSIPVGVFLSQSFFWQENRKYKSEKIHLEIDGKQFFTKTAKDWFDETGLTTDQQQKVRSILCTASVLEERLVGNPAKMFYHIDFEALVSVINQYLVSGVSASADRRGGNVFKEQTKRGKAKNRVGNKPILSLGLNPKLESDLNPSLESDLNPNYPILESLDSFESEGERTPPAPNPSNLQSPKKESGLVAPGRADCDGSYGVGKIEFYPAAAEDEDAFAQWLPSLHTAMENNAPGSMPKPPYPLNLGFCGNCMGIGYRNGRNGRETCEDCEGSGHGDQKIDARKFEVTAIASPTELPGVTLVEASPKLPPNSRVATTLEAEQKIIEWAAFGGIETVRQRHNLAMRRFKDEDMPALAAHYCSVYTKNPANKERLLKDPVTHFSDGLFSYLKNEESFGRNNAPKEGGATRQNGTTEQPKYTPSPYRRLT